MKRFIYITDTQLGVIKTEDTENVLEVIHTIIPKSQQHNLRIIKILPFSLSLNFDSNTI